ncbi:MAG: geranylgeranyl reductase family protein [Chloroflexi bacterium]|nr:geranylgeranyl reductase family protein [Chloroflexota bacterium]
MTGKPVYDAIIVGAGPAGSATAAFLAQRGFHVLLLDRAAFPRDKACGEYSSPQSGEVLGRLGALSAVERAGARRLRSMRVISPGGQTFWMDYSASGEAAAQVLATPRRILDATLVDYARQCGAEVRERAKVEGVSMRDGRASGVVLRRKDGGTHEEQARLIVGADGIHSVVVRSLGLSAPVRWPLSLGMVAHYKGYSGLDDWGEMHLSERGYAGLAPQSGGLLNVGLVMPMRLAAKQLEHGASARFEAFAFSFPGVARALAGAERVSAVRGVGPIGARVRRSSGAGFILVGDAAGFFDPFTGEGVYKALRGAELAAEAASYALDNGDLSAPSLARYSRLRRREFTSKDLVCRLVQAFVGLPPAMDYVASRLAERPKVRAVLTGVLGDFADPRAALSPFYLWSLLRP